MIRKVIIVVLALAVVRDALLPKLLSGEIRFGHRVRGGQPEVEAVGTAE